MSTYLQAEGGEAPLPGWKDLYASCTAALAVHKGDTGAVQNEHLVGGAITPLGDMPSSGMLKRDAFPIQARPIVLVVEDDELLRALLIEVISEAGAFVEAVGTADAGLKAFEKCKDIGLIVTDVMTPGRLTGWDLAKAVNEQRPELPVIITSGYSFEHSTELPPNASFLPKPWSLVQLTDMVKARFSVR